MVAMKKVYLQLLAALLLLFSTSAPAALRVFACEPEWGALATELGGPAVSVYTATTGLQDPHLVEARPSLIAQMRKADLVVCTGGDLEQGWLPLLFQQGGNSRVQPGGSGYFEAAAFVTLLEVPSRLDRAEGDVHAMGNPHLHLDPRNIALVAAGLAKRLAQVDGANAAQYQVRHDDFAKRWTQAIRRWEQQGASLKGIPIVTQHKSWSYLSHWLGLREIVTLEPKPGIPPSSAYLSQVLAELKQKPAKMVIRAAYQDPRPARWLAERAGIPAVELPFTVGGSDQAKDLFGLFDDTVARLLKAVQCAGMEECRGRQDAGGGQ